MVTIIIDVQAGSGGKGKVAAYLALEDQPDIVAASFGPNAGHTVYHKGHKLIFRHLPAGSVWKDAEIIIGASAVIDLAVLEAEIEMLEKAGVMVRDRLLIHPRAVVIQECDRENEAALLRGISSTMKGVGSAQARKVMRTAKLAGDFLTLRNFTEPYNNWRISDALAEGREVQIETSQGFDLCINHGVSYPFCTSRQINASQVLADFALPPSTRTEVVGVVRPFPIRVGNISETETSGPYADDSKETTWEQIAKDAGMSPKGYADLLEQEKTTVTQRQRRVFTFSFNRFRRFCDVNDPAYIALNFADQIDWTDRGLSAKTRIRDLNWSLISQKTRDFIERLDACWDFEGAKYGDDPYAGVKLVGTGPGIEQVVDLR